MDNGNLVIALGPFPGMERMVDLGINGSVSILGEIKINYGAKLSVLPGSHVSFATGAGLTNYGELEIVGTSANELTTLTGPSRLWYGIRHWGGKLRMEYAELENAYAAISLRSEATIKHCNITGSYRAISIESALRYQITGNKIYFNDNGIVVTNNYVTINASEISLNEIYQNLHGLIIYNSNSKILQNYIHQNKTNGIRIIRKSDPLIKGNCVTETSLDNVAYPEMLLESDSLPILDDGRNDINSDNSGYSLYNSGSDLSRYEAINNYWGTTNVFEIASSIYPHLLQINYVPFCIVPNTDFASPGAPFKQALAAEEIGDLSLAKQLFELVVTSTPDSLEALQSLGRLCSIYAYADSLVPALRSLFNSYLASCLDSAFVQNAAYKLVMLDRVDGLYPSAILGYEDLLQDGYSEVDSLLCLLDIAYTLEDSYHDNPDKLAHLAYDKNGLVINSLYDAEGMITQLWNTIMTIQDSEVNSNAVSPAKITLANYPNPFNPSTTMAFSLVHDTKVNLCIYNIRGQKVRDLLNTEMTKGFQKIVWDGKDNDNRSVSSGLYFVRLDTGNTSIVKKVMLLK